MPTLSPNEAAKQSGVSRRSIMRAIASGEIIARRDNRNQWQIEAENLAQWAPNGSAQAQAQPTPTSEPQTETINAELLIQSLRDLVQAERRRADAAESDRDAWREMAQRSWWKRITG
jgi:excisionase family DNA binding protein